MGRIARSWRMAKQSWGLLMKDKELLILPVFSGIFMIAIMASLHDPRRSRPLPCCRKT